MRVVVSVVMSFGKKDIHLACWLHDNLAVGMNFTHLCHMILSYILCSLDIFGFGVCASFSVFARMAFFGINFSITYICLHGTMKRQVIVGQLAEALGTETLQ